MSAASAVGGEARLGGGAERAIGRRLRLGGGADGLGRRLGGGGQYLRPAAGGVDGGVEVDRAAELGGEFRAALRSALGGGAGLVGGRLALLGQLGPPGVAGRDGVVEGVKLALPGGQRRRLGRQPGGLRFEAFRVGVRLPGGGRQGGRIGLQGGRERGRSRIGDGCSDRTRRPASAVSRAAKPAWRRRCASSLILPSAAATSWPALSALAVAWSASALAASSVSRLTASKVGSTGSG